MSRGTSIAERETERKARTNEYLDSQLKKLREKLSNAKTIKEKQRIRASISSLKNRLGPKTRKDFIRSRNPLTQTKRGLKIRPKKVVKKSTIRKVKYTPTVGKVEEKPTNTSPKTDTPKTDTPTITKTVKKTETPKGEVKKPVKKTTRQKFNEKFIRRKGGGIVKRGTVGARRAENREAARKRAQEAAKLRIKKKKEKK